MSRNQTLVTGATGMTGSHTVQLLLKHGHTVRVLAHNEDERSMRLRLSRTSARKSQSLSDLGRQRRTGGQSNRRPTRKHYAASRGCKLAALATRRAAGFYRALGYEESATYFRKLL
jgi:NAD(P)-dependent dehydrogenase (short-subunit alcohol dehydrogenase family)